MATLLLVAAAAARAPLLVLARLQPRHQLRLDVRPCILARPSFAHRHDSHLHSLGVRDLRQHNSDSWPEKRRELGLALRPLCILQLLTLEHQNQSVKALCRLLTNLRQDGDGSARNATGFAHTENALQSFFHVLFISVAVAGDIAADLNLDVRGLRCRLGQKKKTYRVVQEAEGRKGQGSSTIHPRT